CNPQSCPGGCCANGTCITNRTNSQCGANGAACVSCPANEVCNAGSACQCGAGATCASGQRCTGTACVCDGQSCPNGCCDTNNVCQPGTAFGVCGTGGAACVACDPVRANGCASTGRCQCGNNLSCASGKECLFNGTCGCGPDVCPVGCC